MLERVPITTNLANKMRKAREGQKISQAALATRVRVPRARIKRIECLEITSIDAGEYARLVAALGITKRKAKKKAARSTRGAASTRSGRDARKMRIRATRAVLKDNGLLDVTLGDLLSV